MSHEISKLRQHSETEQRLSPAEASRVEGKEFATVEDLIRADSDQNPVPPEVAERLKVSIAAEPKPKTAWYKKIFGGPS